VPMVKDVGRTYLIRDNLQNRICTSLSREDWSILAATARLNLWRCCKLQVDFEFNNGGIDITTLGRQACSLDT
jgi:hypothetical protein